MIGTRLGGPPGHPSRLAVARPFAARGEILLGALLLIAGCEVVRFEDGASDTIRQTSQDLADAFPRSLVDDSGREVRIAAPPDRILSLVPSATPILMALGRTEWLVGRTDFDRDSALAHLPSVGGGLGASVERIVSLRPRLVIRFDAGSDPATPGQLDAAGIPHLAIRPDGIEDVLRIIELLGVAVAREAAADSLRTSLVGELATVAEEVAGRPRPRVAILLGGNPPLVAGGDTFLHELTELAGGTNVLADAGTLYAPMSVEAILQRSPDILLLSEGSAPPRGLEGIPVRSLPLAVQIPGLDLGSSARLLADLLHPDRAQ
ncbi:MAG: helical backbone metal receptor [Gemmatimonadota bacterium]